MNTQPAIDLRRKIAGLFLITAPVMMLMGDAIRVWAGDVYAWLVLLKLSFACFVPAILALVRLQSRRADRTGLLGGGLALVGCLAGAGIVTSAMVGWAVESAALDPSALRAIEDSMRQSGAREYVVLYPLPGLSFPLGLLILGCGLWRARAVSPAVATLLALGAILFPVGRIGSVSAAVIASGVALSAALGLIGWRILNWTADEWQRLSPYHEAHEESAPLESQASAG